MACILRITGNISKRKDAPVIILETAGLHELLKTKQTGHYAGHNNFDHTQSFPMGKATNDNQLTIHTALFLIININYKAVDGKVTSADPCF